MLGGSFRHRGKTWRSYFVLNSCDHQAEHLKIWALSPVSWLRHPGEVSTLSSCHLQISVSSLSDGERQKLGAGLLPSFSVLLTFLFLTPQWGDWLWAASHIYILSYKEVTTSALHGEFPSYSEEPEARERKLSAWSQLENDQQGFFPLLYLEFTPNSYWRICCCLVPKLCPTLCDPIDCSQRGSSVHGIFQARILVHVAISHSR